MSETSQTVQDTPAIILDKVNKWYGAMHVLRDVSLTVGQGERVVVCGPSGSGKSTMIRCINRLEEHQEGTIIVDGTELRDDLRALDQIRSNVGMVFQSFNLFPHLTVLRNVSLAQIRTLGRSAKEADARSLQLLERVGLADKAQHYPARCSGGQQQRIAIARALALDPELMLFDEPTSALDPELGLEVLAVMKELAGEGMSMIVVTHEMHFAETVSDRVVVMADGRIIEHGPSQRVMREPEHERVIQFLQAVRNR